LLIFVKHPKWFSKAPMTENSIILFDGLCNLCNAMVRFIVKRDAQAALRFCSMQSDRGRELLAAHNIQPEAVSTFVLIEGNHCLTRSDAVLKIARHLSGIWQLLSIMYIVPRPVRDFCYDVIARNRYRWFGKRESCLAPAGEHLNRFLV
jgi:predicted DCC family thiol-disulfide oxidoreductase YuxK